MIERHETMIDLVLDCIPRSRFVAESELWERIERACKREDVLTILPAIQSSLNDLKAQGKIQYLKRHGVRRIA